MTDVLISSVLRWIAVIALGSFLVVLIVRLFALFLKEMVRSETNPKPGVWIEANWGGLGGGLSGWRVSNAIIYLVLISFLLGCLSLAVVSLNPAVGNKGEDNKSEDKKSEENKGEENKASQGQKTDIGAKDQGQKNADKKNTEQKADEAKPPEAATDDGGVKKLSAPQPDGKKTGK